MYCAVNENNVLAHRMVIIDNTGFKILDQLFGLLNLPSSDYSLYLPEIKRAATWYPFSE